MILGETKRDNLNDQVCLGMLSEIGLTRVIPIACARVYCIPRFGSHRAIKHQQRAERMVSGTHSLCRQRKCAPHVHLQAL